MLRPTADAASHNEDEDGIRGPVGTQFGEALHAVAKARGFKATYPGFLAVTWVEQSWQGRELETE